MTDRILSAIDKGLAVLQGSLNNPKVFDNIDHELLQSKLEYYRFNNASVTFPNSYLTGRRQYAFNNGMYTTLGEAVLGVLQDFILV